MHAVYGEQTLQKTQIYSIIMGLQARKNVSDSKIAAIASAVEENGGCVTTRVLASAIGLSDFTIRTILHIVFGLVKKFSCWVPKLFDGGAEIGEGQEDIPEVRR